MNWFSEAVSNTISSAKDVVTNTSGSALEAVKDPVVGSLLTFGVNPTALPVYQQTGITPLQQFVGGAAAGGAVMAAPVVAGMVGGAGAGMPAIPAFIPKAADLLKDAIPRGGDAPQPAPFVASQPAQKQDNTALLGVLAIAAIAAAKAIL